MSAEKFAPGDVVQLNSGGTKMTVSAVVSGELLCVYSDERGKVVSVTIPVVAAKKYEAPTAGAS